MNDSVTLTDATIAEGLARRIVDPRHEFCMPVTAVKPIGLHSLWPLAVRGAILRGRVVDGLGL